LSDTDTTIEEIFIGEEGATTDEEPTEATADLSPAVLVTSGSITIDIPDYDPAQGWLP
jgi:hypothetical protein